MNMVFRDHTISDLIGFVYSGMDPGDAAGHLLHNIKEAAQPVLAQGRDAVRRLFSMERMPGNTIQNPGANFCGDFMMRCSRREGSKRLRFRRRFPAIVMYRL